MTGSKERIQQLLKENEDLKKQLAQALEDYQDLGREALKSDEKFIKEISELRARLGEK